jgi:nitroreductase
MELTDVISKRQSCRSFQKKPVDDTTIRSIIDLARNAPSASNRQEWRFVAVKDPAKISAIAEKAGDQKWLANAPMILACCADTNNHTMRCRQPCYPIDLAIIIDHITLIAADKGLGTCWIGAFEEDVVKEICGIPKHVRVVELLPIGYPADTAREKKRMPVDEILFADTWGQKL